MENLGTIPSCSFYGRKKFKLRPSPDISDGSGSSDDEENMTLKQIQNKIRQTVTATSGTDSSDDEENLTLFQIQTKMKQVMDLTSAYNELDEEDISGIEQNFDEEDAEIQEPTAKKMKREKKKKRTNFQLKKGRYM
nr:uncharacterized protein LOC111503366 [Leptinotarsa decemlineata]